MRDDKTAGDGRPSLTWVPVVDARSRTRMEARWRVTTTPAGAAVSPAYHAA